MCAKSSGPTVICTTSAPNASQIRAFSMISGWPRCVLSNASWQMMHFRDARAA
jgi:hypothetical protein